MNGDGPAQYSMLFPTDTEHGRDRTNGGDIQEHYSSSDTVGRGPTTSVTPNINDKIFLVQHTCEICRESFNGQFSFFEHLKTHYENVPTRSSCTSSSNKKYNTPEKSKRKKTGKDLCKKVDSGRESIRIEDSSDNTDKSPKKQVFSNTVKLEESLQNINQITKFQNKAIKTKRNTTEGQSSFKPCLTCKKPFHRKDFELHITNCQNCVQQSVPSVPHIKSGNVKLDISQEVDGQCDQDNCIKEEVILTTDHVVIKDDNYSTLLDIGGGADDDDEEETELMYLKSNICPSCDEYCETKENLESHIRDNHPEIVHDGWSQNSKKKGISSSTTTSPVKKSDVLKCHQCERIFSHRNSLVYHMRGHTGERPYKCDVCGKCFFATSALKVHIRLHSGEKPYACDDCGREFRQWGDLKYHKISIHSEERAFQCEFCGKNFARKYSLVVHRRIHTNERNYKCEHCSKSFRAASYLQNHRRIHTGEKPHKCSICGKSFRVRSDLKRHMRCHPADMKNKVASFTTAIAAELISVSIASETSVKVFPEVTSNGETCLLIGTSVLPMQQETRSPVGTTSTATPVLHKLSLVDQTTEFKTVQSNLLCDALSTMPISAQSQLVANCSPSAFNLTLADGSSSHSTADVLTADIVSETVALYQDTGQNLEIFSADGSRTSTMVIVPLNHSFIQE